MKTLKIAHPETYIIMSGDSTISVTIDYTGGTLSISLDAKDINDNAFVLEALEFGRELLRTYKESNS